MQSELGYDNDHYDNEEEEYFSSNKAESCPTIYLTFKNKYSAVGFVVSSTRGGNEVALVYFLNCQEVRRLFCKGRSYFISSNFDTSYIPTVFVC